MHAHNQFLQDEMESSRIKTSELQVQQAGFDNQLAQAVLAASDQRSFFDNQMAKAELEAVGMRTAYEQLKCDNIEQRETALQVGNLYHLVPRRFAC